MSSLSEGLTQMGASLLVWLMPFLFIEGGTAILCYSCHQGDLIGTYNNGDFNCSDPFLYNNVTESFISPISLYNFPGLPCIYCVKTTFTQYKDKRTGVMRDCSPMLGGRLVDKCESSAHPYYSRTIAEYCLCDTDYCNSAFKLNLRLEFLCITIVLSFFLVPFQV